VLDTALTSQPGEIVEYNYPFKPEAWTPPPIPEYIHKTIEACLRDLDDVSAQHDASQARVPQGVRSGIAIAQLQEEDESMLGPSIMGAEDGLGLLGSWILRLLNRYVKEERLIKIVGQDRAVETRFFKGENLVGKSSQNGVNYFDVHVQMGSQLPWSKSARLEFMIQLVQYGILNPDLHRQQILRMLEIGSEDPLLQESKLDQDAVRRENIQMSQGLALPINAWDNDDEHLPGHRNFQKRAEYERIIQVNPQIGEVFEQHIAQHVARMQETFRVQAESQMQQQPGAAPAGALQPPESQPPAAGPPSASAGEFSVSDLVAAASGGMP